MRLRRVSSFETAKPARRGKSSTYKVGLVRRNHIQVAQIDEDGANQGCLASVLNAML